MSFFDDNEPPTTRTKPRKPAAAGIAPASDPQQLLVRRLVAAGIGVVIVFALVFGVKGCLDGRKQQALKDYNRDVASLVGKVNDTTDEFFNNLVTTGTTAVEVQTQISQSRQQAESQTEQAKRFSVPGDMKPAQRSLLLSLGLIEETIGKVADKILSALSNDSATAEPAVLSITAEMQAFLAADVVYKRRTKALIDQVLVDNDISGDAQTSQFLPNLDWLDAAVVARRIHADAAAGAGAGSDSGKAASGTHGHALLAVSVGDTTLDPSASSNHIPVSSDLTFNAKIANQGENAETNVVVEVTIKPANGGKSIQRQASVDQTEAGTETTVPIALKQTPPIGTASTVKVDVRKVNGEKTIDNNSLTFPVIFDR